MDHLIFLNNLPLDSVLERALKATQSSTNPQKWALEGEVITVNNSNTWHSNKDPNIYRGAIELAEYYFNKSGKTDKDDPFSTPYSLAIRTLKNEFQTEYLNLQERIQQEANAFLSPLDSNSNFINQKNEIIALLDIADPAILEALDQKLNKLTNIAIGEVINTVGYYNDQKLASHSEDIDHNGPVYSSYDTAEIKQFLQENFLPPPVKNKFKIK